AIAPTGWRMRATAAVFVALNPSSAGTKGGQGGGKISDGCRLEEQRIRLFRTAFLMFSINSPNMSDSSVLYSKSGHCSAQRPTEINALAQRVHGVKVFLPKAIDRIQDDVTLQAFHGSRLFVT